MAFSDDNYSDIDEDEPYEEEPYEEEVLQEDDSRFFSRETLNESASDIWEEFLENLQGHWNAMKDDPYEYSVEFFEMVWEKRNIVFPTISAILILLFIARSGPIANESAQQRFVNFSSSIMQTVKSDKKLQPISAHNLLRSLTYAARRLSGLDDSLDAKQPIVLLFAANDQNQIYPFTHKFSASFSKSQAPNTFVAEFDCRDMGDRMEFERRIFSRLSNTKSKHKLLILNNIDRLSQMTPLVLHSLADNENSPFKEVVIIATVTLTEMPRNLLEPKQCTELISNHLLASWSSEELSRDHIYPIVSRLTALPVCIKY